MISLAMIVKNEAEGLTRCLDSVRGLVGQMVIIDTGSTDNTVELAHKAGALCHHFDWCDDFSAARNESLKHCVGDWILVLDGDEAIRRIDHDTIRGATEGPLYNTVYEHRIRHYYADGNAAMLGHTPEACNGEYPYKYDDIGGRLFRNNIGLHYEGRLHEKLMPQQKLINTGWANFTIQHYGKVDKGRERGKANMYLDIARKAFCENSSDPKCVFNYITHARIAYSWEDVRTAIDAYADTGDPIPLSVGIIAGELAHHDRDFDKALRQFQDVLRASPNNAYALTQTAVTLAAVGRLEEARTLAQAALANAPGFTHAKYILERIKRRLDGVQQQSES